MRKLQSTILKHSWCRLSSPKKKNTEYPKRYSASEKFRMIYFELYSCVAQVRERPWCFALCSPFGEPPRSNFARLACASADSLVLHYLRRRTLFVLRRGRGKSPFLRQKMKNTEYPKRYSVFLAEKERFELSRRLPDLHP